MKYYKTDSRRISFREYWNISSGFGFMAAWLCKIFGVPLKLADGIPELVSFRERVIEAQLVPSGIAAKLNSGIIDLKKLGFDQFWFYTSKDSLIGGVAYGLQTLHSSYTTIGKVIFVSYRGRECVVVAFVSEPTDETLLGTTNNKQRFNNPPGYHVQRRLHATATQLWELHQNRLAALSQSNSPKTISDFDQVVMFEDKTSRMSYEHKIARGIWVEMTESEVMVLRAKAVPPGTCS